MADPICHATQGALFLLAPFIAFIRKRVWLWILVIIGAIIGALPDLLGMVGYLFQHNLYESAHWGSIRSLLVYIPMVTLHYFVDSLTYNPAREWYGWNVRIWLEAVMWALNIVVIYWFVRIWKRNTGRERTGRRLRQLTIDN